MAASLAILARRGSSSTRCHLPGLGLGLGLDTLRCGRVRPLSMQHADPLRISSICNLGDGRKARLPPRTAVQPPAPHRSCTAVFAQPDRNRRYINIPSTSSSSSSSSSPSAIDATLPAAPAASPSISPAPSWLDRLPTSLRWTRPYFELSRLDKPIGSWLLYWPCGEQALYPYHPHPLQSSESNRSLTARDPYELTDTIRTALDSLVDHDGSLLLLLSALVHLVPDCPLWNGSRRHARGRVHHQ